MKKNIIDVAFLDIEMPELDGFEVANQINANSNITNNCAIVFVTAYNKYAVEAFRINALDYLVKPVNKERLKETLERIIKELNINISPAEVNIKCFSKFKITVGNTEVKFRTKKAEELLAFLIDKHEQSVPRNTIIDCLWGDFDGDKALINFNTTLFYLRKALSKYGINMPIIYKDSSYILETPNIKCDYFSFIDFNLYNNEISHVNVTYYEKILSLYTSGYLEANNYSWSERNRLNLKEKYIRLLLRVADYYKAENQNNKAIEFLKLGFTFEPLSGNLADNLINLLLEEGNHSLAAGYYKLYEDALQLYQEVSST